MKWSLCIILALTLRAQSVAEETGSQAALAQAAITQWVEARQSLAETRAAWETDREVLAQSIQLHEAALADVKERLSETGTSSKQIAREREQLLAEQANLQEASERVATLLSPIETKIRHLAKTLPAPLLSKLEPLLARIPNNPQATDFSLPERVQTVVGIVSEVEKFNGSISVHSEIQRNQAGEDVQVRTLYLGLAQAYSVDQSGRAGVGSPGPEGWEWTPADHLAPKINRAIAIYENSQPAAFVSLPVQLN